MTMTDIHVPDEVVEAAAAVLLGRVNAPENVIYAASRAAVTAALAAWVECGMAREGMAGHSTVHKGAWVAKTPRPLSGSIYEDFPVLILKTAEAP